MTLSLAMIAHSFCCVVTDRRISSNGQAADDEFDKTCTLNTRDSRVAVSFSGLARARRFHAHVHLLESLKGCAAPDFSLVGVMRRLTTKLNREFLQHPDIRSIPKCLRKFSLMFAGFRYVPKGDQAIFGLISNYQDFEQRKNVDEPWEKFEPFLTDLPAELPKYGFGIGQVEAVDSVKTFALLADGHRLSATSVRSRLVYLVQNASTASISRGTIGGQCTSIIIHRDWKNLRSEVGYHVLQPQRTLYLPATDRACPPEA